MEGRRAGALLFIAATFAKGLLAVDVTPSANPVYVGDNVTLELSPPTAISTGTWLFNGSTVVMLFQRQQQAFPGYEGKASVDLSSGALFLESVRLEDSGTYRVQGLVPQISGQAVLTVLAPVSNVTVQANITDPVEFNDTVRLSCSALGSAPSYRWLSGSSEITAGQRFQLSEGNRTLTISSVLRSDRGPLYCFVSNSFSNATSQPVYLNVLYGPDNVSLAVSPKQRVYLTGSDLVLSCSAQSNPSAWFQWAFEGSLLNRLGQELRLVKAQQNQTGNYTCWAYNNVTQRYAAETAHITLIAPVSNVTVQANITDPVEFNDTVRLSCSALGSAPSYRWLSGSSEVTAGQRFQLSEGNRTLTISSVLRSDRGPLYCFVSNSFSNATSQPVYLNVLYGPDNVSLAVSPKQRVYLTGSDLVLSCSVQSNPSAWFQWAFEGSLLNRLGQELRLVKAQQNQTGNYTCWAYNNVTQRYASETAHITLIAPVSNVTVQANITDPVEFNDTVRLSCSALGSAPSYRWLNGSSEVTAGQRFQLSEGNRTLTISSVLRSDRGPLYCFVSNSFSNATSQPVYLNVLYGPDNVSLAVSPKQRVYLTGSDLVLSCSAQSNPSAWFQWAFEGSLLNRLGQELRLVKAQQNQTGNYTCWAYNNVTQRYASETAQITLIKPITVVAVRPAGQLPIQDQAFNLSCEVTGPVVSRSWLKDGQPLSPSNRTSFSQDNSTLSFSAALLSDDGSYQCAASNPVSNRTSPGYQLLVNYGPETPVIAGPQEVRMGRTVTLSCSAASQPPSLYYWSVNGTWAGEGSELKIGQVSPSNTGVYTCTARNTVTNRTSSAERRLTVTGPPSGSPALAGTVGFTATALLGISALILMGVL